MQPTKLCAPAQATPNTQTTLICAFDSRLSINLRNHAV